MIEVSGKCDGRPPIPDIGGKVQKSKSDVDGTRGERELRVELGGNKGRRKGRKRRKRRNRRGLSRSRPFRLKRVCSPLWEKPVYVVRKTILDHRPEKEDFQASREEEEGRWLF